MQLRFLTIFAVIAIAGVCNKAGSDPIASPPGIDVSEDMKPCSYDS